MEKLSYWWIITPYFDEPVEWIARCVDSIKKAALFLGNELTIKHLLVSDGVHRPEVRSLTDFHIELAPGFGDYGDSPRYLGSSFAKLSGANALSFVDSDNWVYPNHLEAILSKHTTSGAHLITTEREFYDVYGVPLHAKCLTSDGKNFSDTNCITLFHEALSISDIWGTIPEEEHAIDDRVLWDYVLQTSIARAHTSIPTVAYRARVPSFYHDLGEIPPSEYLRPIGDNISRAIKAFEGRTGRNPRLRWMYEIPHDKHIRAKKVAKALMKTFKFDSAIEILSELKTKLPHDDDIKILLKDCHNGLSTPKQHIQES